MPQGNRPGDELGGRYTLVDLLSESRGGRFWRARDQVLARTVALHVIAADDERAAGLLDAARRSAAVQDRRMLRVLDADERDGLVYVVNEWGTGTSLDSLLSEQPLSPRRAAWLVSEVAEAMAVAHAVDVPHGHLVPENVLVDTVGSVRLIGHAVDAALRGVGPGSVEDDLVNLVGLLYSGLTGRWAGRSYSEVEPAPVEDGCVLRPRQVRAGIPRALDQLCGDVLDAASGGILNGRRGSSPRDAAGIAELLQEFVGDPVEMAAAEAARGHGSHHEHDHHHEHLENHEHAEGHEEPEDPGDGPTRREMPAPPPPAAAGGDDEGGPTVAVPVVGAAASGEAGDQSPDEADTLEPGAAHGPEPDDTVGGETGDTDDDTDGEGGHADVPTQAGVPIFRDDTDEVGWVGKEQEKRPPPPPLEDPPERPLFAPDPPAGQPVRRARGQAPARAPEAWHEPEDSPWWATGGGTGSGTGGIGVIYEEPQDARGPVPGRRWFRLAVLVAIAALSFLVVVFVADLLRGGQPLGVGPAPDEPTASEEASEAPVEPLSNLSAASLDPQGDGEENDGDLPLVVDGDQSTTWSTSTYFQQLGPQGLKTGVGLVIDLGESTAVRQVDLQLVGSPTTAQLFLTEDQPADVTGLDPVGEIAATGPQGSAELSGEQSGRYLVIWLTRLPAVEGGFRGEVAEVVVGA